MAYRHPISHRQIYFECAPGRHDHSHEGMVETEPPYGAGRPWLPGNGVPSRNSLPTGFQQVPNESGTNSEDGPLQQKVYLSHLSRLSGISVLEATITPDLVNCDSSASPCLPNPKP